MLLSEVGPDFEHLARNQAASIHSSGAVVRLCPAHLFLGGSYLEIENRYGASRIIDVVGQILELFGLFDQRDEISIVFLQLVVLNLQGVHGRVGLVTTTLDEFQLAIPKLILQELVPFLENVIALLKCDDLILVSIDCGFEKPDRLLLLLEAKHFPLDFRIQILNGVVKVGLDSVGQGVLLKFFIHHRQLPVLRSHLLQLRVQVADLGSLTRDLIKLFLTLLSLLETFVSGKSLLQTGFQIRVLLRGLRRKCIGVSLVHEHRGVIDLFVLSHSGFMIQKTGLILHLNLYLWAASNFLWLNWVRRLLGNRPIFSFLNLVFILFM